MNERFLYPFEIDRLLHWRCGLAARLARSGKLPHYRLPDGSIRFLWEEVWALVQRVPARTAETLCVELTP